jgi:hypothetical protein
VRDFTPMSAAEVEAAIAQTRTRPLISALL